MRLSRAARRSAWVDSLEPLTVKEVTTVRRIYTTQDIMDTTVVAGTMRRLPVGRRGCA